MKESEPAPLIFFAWLELPYRTDVAYDLKGYVQKDILVMEMAS